MMIIPGIHLGKVRIGDAFDNYGNAKFVEALSLGQNVYRWEEYLIRFDKNNNVNWVLIKKESDENFQNIIKVGTKFNEVIKEYDLLYDDDEFCFSIKDIEGLAFSFDSHISDKEILYKPVTSIIVYNTEMDSIKHLLGLDEVTLKNLHEYMLR